VAARSRLPDRTAARRAVTTVNSGLRRAAVAAVAVVELVAVTPGLALSAPDRPPRLPPLYLGVDSYLHWDKLPYLEIGDRVAGQSSADPVGSNNDSLGILGTRPGGGRVLFDQVGPGVVTFMRMQEAFGGPWRLTADGHTRTIAGADLGGADPTLPYPLSLNTEQSRGSSILAVPMPYADHLTFESSAPNGNFYSMYRKLPVDVPVPRWDAGATKRAADVLAAAGHDVAPKGIPHRQGTVTLGPAGTATPVTTITGRHQIRALTFRVPFTEKVRFGSARLRVYWDGEPNPSIDAPVGYLTGDGAGVFQPADRQLVQAFPVGITGDGRTFMEYRLNWPMPFGSSARIVLVSGSDAPVQVAWSVRYEPFTDPMSWVGTFHANYTDVPRPRRGHDLTLLDVTGSGKLVGTVVNFGAVGDTLEGDPHIYVDGSRTPQIAVTGTEEWGLGGDYWQNGRQVSLPLGGLPSSQANPRGADQDGAAEYRFLIADSVPFTNHITVTWEHGVANESDQHYRATMMWYGTPTVTSVGTGRVVPGGHRLSSAYAYTTGGAEAGTVTSGGSTFRMALRRDNVGGYLRRTFDSCVADQRATVYLDGVPAGTWYNPGASRKALRGETDRCWRDDDFPLPRSLLAGRSSVEVRIEAAPVWTAARYEMFSFVAP
jgi:hypothetical protein